MLDFRMNKKLIDELQDDISCAASRIKDNLTDIDVALRSLSRATYEYDSTARKENPYFVKSVIKYIAAGNTEESAIITTATDYGVSISRVAAVYKSQKQYTAAIKLYARKYFVQVMRRQGFKWSIIAKCLRISETHAHRLYNSKCIF